MKTDTHINKSALIASIIILAISVCIILPIEYSRASLVSDLKFSHFTVGVALVVLMYAFMGRHTYKGLLLLLCSCIFSIICWSFALQKTEQSKASSEFFELIMSVLSFLENFAIWYMGAVTGVVAGLIFLIVNARFLKDKNRNKLLVKRLISYLVILGVVCMLVAKGGDWIF